MVLWLVMAGLAACQPTTIADRGTPDARVVHESARWSSRLLIGPDKSWKPSVTMRVGLKGLPDGVEAGSATPVTGDGYFLTAAHVLRMNPGGVLYLSYGQQNHWRPARVVWVDQGGDMALIHAPIKTAGYFQWSAARERVPAGTSVFHLGAATDKKQNVGRMLSDLPPESWLTGCRMFRTNVELMRGDSGGGVLDSKGRLLGINSAVKYRMPGMRFLDTEVVRPNLRKLERIIQADRIQSHRRY